MEEKNWHYYISDRHDWVRVDGENIQVKPCGQLDWFDVENLKYKKNDDHSEYKGKNGATFKIYDDLKSSTLAYQDKELLLYGFAFLLDAYDSLSAEMLGYKSVLKKLLDVDGLENMFKDDQLLEGLSLIIRVNGETEANATIKKLKVQISGTGLEKVYDECRYLYYVEIKGEVLKNIRNDDTFRKQIDEHKKELFENKDPSTNNLAPHSIEYLSAAQGDNVDPVKELVDIMRNRLIEIGNPKNHYWNGQLKSTFLFACIQAIEAAQKKDESFSLYEALNLKVQPADETSQRFKKKSKQSLTALNAMNWHRHFHFLRRKKTHTITHKNASEVCRFRLMESLRCG